MLNVSVANGVTTVDLAADVMVVVLPSWPDCWRGSFDLRGGDKLEARKTRIRRRAVESEDAGPSLAPRKEAAFPRL